MRGVSGDFEGRISLWNHTLPILNSIKIVHGLMFGNLRVGSALLVTEIPTKLEDSLLFLSSWREAVKERGYGDRGLYQL